LDPNVKHCILVKKRQSSPTTNPTTTTTNPTTTTTTNPATTTTNPTTTTTNPTTTTTTNPATTTTNPTTTTDSNSTSSRRKRSAVDDGIQYEYEFVDCNGPLKAYRHASISSVLISAIFNLTRFMILSGFFPF
jgi:hypothetical protein